MTVTDNWFDPEDETNDEAGQATTLTPEELIAQGRAEAEAALQQKYGPQFEVLSRMTQALTPQQEASQAPQEQTVKGYVDQNTQNALALQAEGFFRQNHSDLLADPRLHMFYKTEIQAAIAQGLDPFTAAKAVAEMHGSPSGSPVNSGQAPQQQEPYNPRQTVPGMLPFGGSKHGQNIPDISTMSQAAFQKLRAALQG
jgi:hypothetical protein